MFKPEYIILDSQMRNLDEESSEFGEIDGFPFQRILFVISRDYDEVFAVSDMSFFLVNVGSKYFFSRSTLYDLLTSDKTRKFFLSKSILSALRQLENEKKPEVAVSMITEDTVEHVFQEVQKRKLSLRGLASTLYEYGKNLGVLYECGCTPLKGKVDKGVYEVLYGRLLDTLDLLGGKYGFGKTTADDVIEDGNPCIIIGKRGIVVLERSIMSAI